MIKTIGRYNVKKSERTIRIVTTWALVLTFFTTILLFLIMKNPKPFALGFLVGGLVSVLNFRLMVMTLNKAIRRSAGNAVTVVSSNYYLRYLIYGLVLIIAVKGSMNYVAVAAGFLVVKAVVIISVTLDSFKKH